MSRNNHQKRSHLYELHNQAAMSGSENERLSAEGSIESVDSQNFFTPHDSSSTSFLSLKIEFGANDFEDQDDGFMSQQQEPNTSAYFSDGLRIVDFVLVYEPSDDGIENSSDDETHGQESLTNNNGNLRRIARRRVFESNLVNMGLELEHINGVSPNTAFVLIHAPFDILLRQAEIMRIKKPVIRNDVKKETDMMTGCLNTCLKHFKFLDHDDTTKRRIELEEYFSQPFMAAHFNSFVGHENPDKFFTRSDRIAMVYDILIRTRYENMDNPDHLGKFRFGIERLVKNRTYLSAFPLHEAIDYAKNGKNIDYQSCTDRQVLYESWVKLRNIAKYQPLHLIKNYFGTKIGFYFAWLGFYTRFLYISAPLGIICVIYGILTLSSDVPSNDICVAGDNILICPVCDKFCDFIKLSSSCLYAKFTHVFDNYFTIIFAAAMSIWSTLFLEGWKRYHAELSYKWNVFGAPGIDSEEEIMRPEFQFRAAKINRVNPVTRESEPHLPIGQKAVRIFGSTVTVIFFVSLVLALLFGIIVYRVIIQSVFYAGSNDEFLHSQAMIITSLTAATINLAVILIMNYFYTSLAIKLTEWECPRTQSEFDNSFTFKVFLFQFVNFYSSLFYIAFIKGRFSGFPGTLPYADPKSFRLFGHRLEECDPAGCMVELVIQLAVIMCGKQIFNAVIEISYPVVMQFWRNWRLQLPETRHQRRKRIDIERQNTILNSNNVAFYEKDYCLNPAYQQFLFDEYLELIIQLGFVTLFVAAFPLAPLFALINNVLEIRLDAYKFIVTMRRPVPVQALNIGVWSTILNVLSILAVLCNAFVIGFCSDIVPKIYYQFVHGNLDKYIDDSLAYYEASRLDILNSSYAADQQTAPKWCRYQDYRRPPCVLNISDSEGMCSDSYEFQYKWWIILSFRLIFVLIFVLSVLSIKAIFAYLIPDVPTNIKTQIQRERFLMRQAILQQQLDIQSDIPKMMTAGERTKTTWMSNDVAEFAYQPGSEADVEIRQQQHYECA